MEQLARSLDMDFGQVYKWNWNMRYYRDRFDFASLKSSECYKPLFKVTKVRRFGPEMWSQLDGQPEIGSVKDVTDTERTVTDHE